MGEDEEDHVSSVSKHSSVKGNISRPHPQRSSRNGRNQNLPPRPRPRNQPRSAQQRQHGEAATMSSAPIGSPSSLNPAAPVFVPQRAVTVESKLPESSTGDRSSRIGHRSGRKGRSHKEANEKENTKNSKADTTQGNIERPQRRKKTGASGSHIHPTIVKESDDLMLRLTEALANGEYDCSICTDTIQRWKPVWSCQVCWAVFHRSCIRKWASHSLGEGSIWRCPGCQSPSDIVPNEYRCWCGKVENPDVDRLATPHSCSQPCLRKRKSGCACTLPCHPGPCPPCYQVHQPPQTCFCGKDFRQVKCIDFDPDSAGWSCGKPCGAPLTCNAAEVVLSDGKVEGHKCQQVCHAPPCPPCEIQETVSCFCGKHTKEIRCYDKQFPKKSMIDAPDRPQSWFGLYQCGDICGRKFDCSVHSCEKRCHPQDADTPKCPQSPEAIKVCPCGKTSINELAERKTCEDPIPVCQQRCGKLLHCGHACEAMCHLNNCPPCNANVTAKCRCGQVSFKLKCFEASETDALLCDKACNSMKNCGRHHCGRQCCDGDHLCTKICSRQLKCGSHNCSVLCHRGPCPTCLEASFEPLICTCGKTELVPPIRCGTKPPPCTHPCIIDPPCGHPKVTHTCHPTDEGCPKCPYLVEKLCICGKRSVKNQPCFRAQTSGVSCGMTCGALMPCGYHRCMASCHLHTSEGIKCSEKCGKPRKSCGHSCQLKWYLPKCKSDPSHSPSACDDSIPCQATVVVSCHCGLHKQEISCQATAMQPSRGLESLPCSDLCARAERNRKLAEALDIDTTASFREPENVKGGYQVRALDFYNNNKLWCTEIEETFREFLKGNAMRLAFKPMNAHKREFIHDLAEIYGFDAESVDHEPFRSVEIYRSNRAALPRNTLSEATKLKNPYAISTGAYASSGLTQLRKHHSGVAYNAIFLEGVKGSTLQTDLQAALNPILRPSKLVFSLKWINDGKDVLLSPGPTSLPIEDVENALHNVIKYVRQFISTSGVALAAELCWVNREGHVSYRESTRQQQKKGGEPSSLAAWDKFRPPKVETSNVYEVLTGGGRIGEDLSDKVAKKEKKKQEEGKAPLLDDWESFEE